jgi:PadR family transcriptional regulator, regulatory protein PadR
VVEGSYLVEVAEAVKKFQKEINGGTASLVLLGVLGSTDRPMYGYQIAKLIEEHSGNVDIMKHGALYPVLRSLESTGLLSSEVEPSVSGPPRRYYRITTPGQETLSRWRKIWAQTRDLVDGVLGGSNDK